MKFTIYILAIFAVASATFLTGGYAQFLPFPLSYLPYPLAAFPYAEQYAASLGGAKVGLYGKSNLGSPFGFPGLFGGLGSSEVYGASLGGAPVGLYGKQNY